MPIPTARTGLLLSLLLVSQAGAGPSLEPRLSTFWDDWLAETGPLLSAGERVFFESLEGDEERDLFVAAFWETRGSAALERWTTNRLAADRIRPRSSWARRAILLFGKPESIEHVEACGGLRPLQIWVWQPWQIARQGGQGDGALTLVLAQRNRLLPGSYAPWDPEHPSDLGYFAGSGDALGPFLEQVEPETCVGPSIQGALASAVPFEALSRAMPWPTGPEAWYGDLESRIDLFGAPRRGESVAISYPGAHGRHTILRAALELDPATLSELVPGQLFDRITFVGDIYKRDYLVDSFEIVHHVAGATPAGRLDLDIYRGLRPGRYRLELHVADRWARTLHRSRRTIEVPRLTAPAPPPPGRSQGYARLTRDEVVLLDTLPSIEVLPVDSRTTSSTDLVAITTGGPIASVVFYLDGQAIARDREAPYSTRAEIGPERHTVRAEAVDAQGRVLASHENELAAESRPFGIHLERPAPGELEIAVDLSLPEGAELARLECFDGRRHSATLSSPPYRCPLPRRQLSGLRYARALATLTTGERTERLLFFGPNAPDAIDVQLVELFVSVFDVGGRPVSGLGATDFRVTDAGRPRQLTRVESLSNLPISVAVLMDLSSSMGRLAQLAAESAERFFEHVMIDGDLASLLAFNDDFHRLVPFTGDIAELRLGTASVRALGSTRLHDGIVWALSQYAGQENRRALVVLSDGADVDSDFPFEQVVAAAVEAGVTVYPISIIRRGETPTDRLEELAARTGGSRFVVASIEALDAAYRRIAEELRAQYLLVYRLDGESALFEPRSVDVDVLRSGMTTRNVHGYYR